MKKLNLFTLVLATLALGVFANDSKEAQTIYKVDTEKSKVLWIGKKVTGQHNGTIDLKSGKVMTQGNDVTAADINIEMESIVVEDLTNPQWNKKLVDHLKSDDFFSVADFPSATFVTTNFSDNNDAGSPEYDVTGNLTIKGITHEISFPVQVDINGTQLTANGSATLDRTKWDVKYGSGSFFKGLGDNMIYDDFEVEFNLVAKAEIVN